MASPDLIVPLPRRRFTDHALIGMAVFVLTEAMLFAGFISAFVITRDSAAPGTWPPVGQPRLPFERTAVNTLALLASGALVWTAHRALRRDGPEAARTPLTLGLGLGALFVGLQGMEWAALLRHGLTLTSSQVGSFFYLVIGCHALHAIVALGLLASCWVSLLAGRLKPSRFGAVQLFWYFVVLLWPAIFLKVYL